MTDDTKDGPAPDVRNAPELHRFEVRVDGELAGFTEYLDDENQRIFFHTEIGDQFAGRGLASTLIRSALTETVGGRQTDRADLPVRRRLPEEARRLRRRRRPGHPPAAIQAVKDSRG